MLNQVLSYLSGPGKRHFRGPIPIVAYVGLGAGNRDFTMYNREFQARLERAKRAFPGSGTEPFSAPDTDFFVDFLRPQNMHLGGM